MQEWMTIAAVLALGAGAPGVMSTPPAPAADGQPAVAPAAEESAEEAAARNALDAQLAEIDARVAKVETLRADFEQRKHTPLLKKPMVSKGRVVMKGPRTLWETRSPRASTMTIDDTRLRIYYPEQKVLEIYELGEDIREFSGSPMPRFGRVRELFEVKQIAAMELGAAADAKGVLALELTPRGEQLRDHVSRVRVLIDTATPCTRRMEIVDADGERTEIDFSEVRLNTKVEDADVMFEAPRGTREVRPLGEGTPKPPPTPTPTPPTTGAGPDK